MCHFSKINFQFVNITNEMRLLYNTIYVVSHVVSIKLPRWRTLSVHSCFTPSKKQTPPQ